MSPICSRRQLVLLYYARFVAKEATRRHVKTDVHSRMPLDQMIQLEPVDHFQDGLDMAVGNGFFCGEQVVRRNQRLVAQYAAKGFDSFWGPIGEIG
jgi:hypothetical protein